MATAEPFFWGNGGRRLTPEEILLERKNAQSLGQQAMSTAPVGHWSQGLNRVLQGLMAGYDEYRADQASKQNASESANVIKALMGGMGSTAAPATTSPAAAPASSPVAPAATTVASAPAQSIVDGLIQRGLPEPAARGFAMNLQDESGLNPSINEKAPLVPGSRGGFGLAQWTGPRRVALEQFAQQSGRPVDDVNTQLDFLVNELKGPEAKAAQSIMAAQNPNDAAVAIARDYLRPSPENLERRVAQYSGGAAPAQVASPTAAPRPSINPAIVQAMSSPYVSDQARSIASALFKNQLDQQTKANDPLRSLQIQEAQGRIAAQPLDLQGKRLANMKVERELQGEGAQPLTAQERQSFGIPPLQPAYKTRSGEIKFGPVGTKITNNVGEAENAFQKEAGKATANRFNDLVSDGQQARQLMSDMSTLLDLGKNIGTGKTAQVKAVLGPFAEAAGLKVDGLSEIQAYEAIVNRVAPSLRVKGSGAQSDYELKNFMKSIPSLGTTQEGNEIAAAVMRGLSQNKVLASEIASKALSGEISRSDAEKQLRELPDPMQPYLDYKKKRSNIDDLLKKYGGAQ